MGQILEGCQYFGQGTSSHCPKQSNMEPSLSTYKVLYQCNNCSTSVVATINRDSGRNIIVMHLLVAFGFSFPTTILNDLVCEHIAGLVNTAADQLSRQNNPSLFS